MKKRLILIFLVIIGIVLVGIFFIYKNIQLVEKSEMLEIEKKVKEKGQAEIGQEKFYEEFGDWKLEAGWDLEQINRNNILKSSGKYSWAILKDKIWDNYALRFKFKRVRGKVHVNFRNAFVEDNVVRYLVSLWEGTDVHLMKQTSKEPISLKNIGFSFNESWHIFEIKGYEDLINIYIDDELVLIYRDSEPILSGGIAFETFKDSEFLIDEIEIFPVLQEEVIEKFPFQRVSNTTRSGIIKKSEEWSGEILITGDVVVLGDLTILPGTIVKFVVGDNQQQGYETPADGYNDLDPTRLIGYGKTHSSLTVLGKLVAKGTSENKILFTSASSEPKIADWEAIQPRGDGSLIENAIIEYSRNGISPADNTSKNIFRNNIIRYTFWGAISSGYCSCQIYNNEIYECGHEGVDVQGGNPIIENNIIYDCHAGIVVLRDSAVVKNNIMRNVGGGIHIGGDATPIIENNKIIIASPDSKKEWRYKNFAYQMFGDPIGTPILTEVYKEVLPRYAVPAYRIEYQNFRVELPIRAEEWIGYGWKDGKWNKINIEISNNKCKFPSGYSMYVLIPNPTQEEKDAEKFNKEHFDIYKIMAV